MRVQMEVDDQKLREHAERELKVVQAMRADLPPKQEIAAWIEKHEFIDRYEEVFKERLLSLKPKTLARSARSGGKKKAKKARATKSA